MPKVGFVHRSLLVDDRSLESDSRVIGPVLARDTQILDQYLPQGYDTTSDMPQDFQLDPAPREIQKPIYHVPIPPRMPSPTGCQCSRDLSQELLLQVDPFLDQLMSNYFEHVSPCYPLTDEEYIMTRIKNRNTLPQTFLVLLVSHALFYWDLSPTLAAYPRPSQDLAWQTSVALNNTSMQKGDMATITTICMGISGRPCQRLVHNAANVARTVALAHIIGLNHDCREWKIRELEKRIRWKAWWGLLIQDRWFNFAQGTPPYIAKSHYDVPIPTVEFLTQGRADSVKHVRAAEVYIQLCRLTEIIGDVLPLIHRIRSSNNGIVEQTSQTEIELDRWVESQPCWMDLGDFYTRPSVPGLLNLQLSYLSVRMLLRRLSWHEISQRESDPHASWLLGCQEAAENIVRFVTSLEKQDLMAFWLPYNAHHFTSAATLLLRCALQTSDSRVREECMISARTLIDSLRRYQEEDKWDLADTCLTQSKTVLKRIDDSLLRTRIATSATAAPTTVSNDLVDGRIRADDRIRNEAIPGNEFSMLPGQGSSLEELFPEIFADIFKDNLIDGQEYFTFEE